MNLDPVYSVWYDDVQVLRRLSEKEAHAASAKANLFQDVTKVELATEPSHYFPICEGVERKGLSRTIADTTCPVCLQERANQLAGWRWRHTRNAEEVAYMTAQGISPTIPGEENENHP